MSDDPAACLTPPARILQSVRPGPTVAHPCALDHLNPEQRAAATHDGGPLLILAGAGTGKTTTLSARVAWLIEQGTPPERIMLLTFTRRAAREMLQRARTMTRQPPVGGVLGGTFHSVAHRFVRLHASSLGLAPEFAVLDAGDAADLLDLIREEHGHAQAQQRFPRPSTLLDIYSRTVNCQRPLSEIVAERFPWCEDHVEAMAALFKAYTARKRALGALDLDDLLLYWRALAQDEVIGAAIEDGFDHVLIDEYQDVNGLQVEIVRALRRRRREADRGRRRPAGDLRLARGLRRAHPALRRALPGRDGRHARAQLPLGRADPRDRQRARDATSSAHTASGCGPTRAGGRAAAARLLPRRVRRRRARCASACSRRASRAWICDSRRC